MYALILHRPGLRGLQATTPAPKSALIFGVPAESFFRIAAPLTMGALSVAGLIYAARGNQNIAMTLALTGVLVSSIVAAGQAVVSEEESGRL